jgi:hypothetical protein
VFVVVTPAVFRLPLLFTTVPVFELVVVVVVLVLSVVLHPTAAAVSTNTAKIPASFFMIVKSPAIDYQCLITTMGPSSGFGAEEREIIAPELVGAKNRGYKHRVYLPLHAAFFARVDLGKAAVPIEKCFHIIEQKSVCVRIRKIQAVVINQLVLLRQPLCPTGLANLGANLLSELIW